MSKLTVVICSKRSVEHLERLIGLLKDQTIAPEVWVWNYNPEVYVPARIADWTGNYSGRASFQGLPSLYHMVETPYICRMADDLFPADPEVLEEGLITLAKWSNPRLVVGPYGVTLRDGNHYTGARHVSTPDGDGQLTRSGAVRQGPKDIRVDFIKSRLMLFSRQGAIHKLRDNFGHNHDDIYVCAQLAGARRQYHVAAGLFFYRDWSNPSNSFSRLRDFADAETIETSQAIKERDVLSQGWLKKCSEAKKG